MKLSSISYRACIVTCIMACFMASTAGAATPQGAAVVSSQAAQYLAPQQFNVRINSNRGAPLVISGVSVADVGATRLGSWKKIDYTRSCTTRSHSATMKASSVCVKPAPSRAHGTSTWEVFSHTVQATRGTLACSTA